MLGMLPRSLNDNYQDVTMQIFDISEVYEAKDHQPVSHERNFSSLYLKTIPI